MVFSSLSFLFCILPLFLLGDSLLGKLNRNSLRNVFLLAISLLFYTWGEAANVLLLVGLGVFNYYSVVFLATSKKDRRVLWLIVGANLLVLIGFKYSLWILSFFIPTIDTAKLTMPLGISFFTFHAISYAVDVYRGSILPARSVSDFLTYFCMFPHLVAGPIVRYAQIQDDLPRRPFDPDLFSFGMYRLFLGLNKKIIIANSVALVADSAFNIASLSNISTGDAWLGVIAYGLQIYFDFSAYSDMAIGLAAMGGFKFEENFLRPYSSCSVREFWTRWHISLSSWLRDYVYIPLGGSRGGALATYTNLLIVFLLCGIWHGANVTFVFWGLWHGFFLVVERAFLDKLLMPLHGIVRRVYTLLAVLTGWVFFRAETLEQAVKYCSKLYSLNADSVTLLYHSQSIQVMLLACVLCALPDRLFPAPTSKNPKAFQSYAYMFQAALALVSVTMLLVGQRNPFIYFNF